MQVWPLLWWIVWLVIWLSVRGGGSFTALTVARKSANGLYGREIRGTCFATSFKFSRGFPGLVDNGNIWPRITTDEAFAETRKRIVESPQRGNNWRPRPSKSNSPALIAATTLVTTS
jgi:hypothetical protein